MTKNQLRAVAHAEAAQVLKAACDHIDLNPDLTEEQEEFVREYIRNNIADKLANYRSRRVQP